MDIPRGLRKPGRIALLVPPAIALLLLAWLLFAMVTNF